MSTKRCRWCGHEITLIPLLGWTHVALLNNLDCSASPR